MNAPRINHVRQFRTSSKHIDIRFKWVIDALEKGYFDLLYAITDDMVADRLTKPLYGDKHRHFCELIGIGPPPKDN